MNRCSIKNGIINKAKQLLDSGLSLEDVNKAFGEDVVTTSQSNEVDYNIVSTELLLSEKADSLFKSLEKNKVKGDDFWNKIQNDLQIPKDQIDILKSFNTTNRDELVTGLLSNYSYTVEINTAKEGIGEHKLSPHNFYDNFSQYKKDGKYYMSYADQDGKTGEYSQIEKEITKQEFEANEGSPTQHYSNLTVPGGTNYTEQEISTPAITPSIKGHAQFSTSNGIGWFRSDDKIEFLDKEDLIKKGIIKQVPCG